MHRGEVIFRTWSVCPVCLKRIPAERIRSNGKVYLCKSCPEHGDSQSIIWRGFSEIEEWINGSDIMQTEEPQCPEECGLCSDHLQKTCCTILNVTERCNLDDCRFCFAVNDSGKPDPTLGEIKESLNRLTVKGKSLVQLSGGEPTVREDLPQIIKAARDAGAKYVQLNTNGIRLGEEKQYAGELAAAGLSFVFMQFDGMDDSVFQSLRGKPLLNVKQQAIVNCAEHNIGVTLVPTLVRDVNTDHIGDIIKYAVSMVPKVRGVHFQPVSFFGRIPGSPSESERITLDELIFEIERQTEGIIKMSDLIPSECNHPLCGFHGSFYVENESVISLVKREFRERKCCCGSDSADRNREFIARHWQRSEVRENCGAPAGDVHDMEYFLENIASHGFTITSMAFQDAGNIDLLRLRTCSLHVYDKGRFVPFCSYYLTKWQ